MELRHLTEEELFYILNCDKLKKVEEYFGKKTTKLLVELSPTTNIPQQKNSFGLAFLSFADAPTYPLILLYSILELVSFSLIPLFFLTGAASLLALLVGSIYILSSYRELKKEAVKTENFFKLRSLQNLCADELSKRLQRELVRNSDYSISLTPWRQEAKVNFVANKLIFVRQAIGTALLVTTALFGTYYFSAGTILAAFGLTNVAAALLSPIGLVLGLGASLVLGGLFGIMQYQSCKLDKLIQHKKKDLTEEIEKKQNYCYFLREKLSLLQHHDHKKETSPNLHLNRKVIPTSPYTMANLPMILLRRKQTYCPTPEIPRKNRLALR